MRCGLFTDALAHFSLQEMISWCRTRGILDLDLGVGGYSPAPHLDAAALLNDHARLRAFVRSLEAEGCSISALNASGNPLHPDPATSSAHDAALRQALRLASALGVSRVVAMSGCPGSPRGGEWPVFAAGAWLPDMEGLWQWQWEQRIAPYWRELAGWAEREAPGVVLCFELHPGMSIYNPASFQLLQSVAGASIQVNFDPSHFWWQGTDPVRVTSELGASIGFAHGKDTRMNAARIESNGVLDFAWPERPPDELPWHFAAVGAGHTLDEWSRLISALTASGYDGVISIEHEDPNLTPEQGIEASLTALLQVIEG